MRVALVLFLLIANPSLRADPAAVAKLIEHMQSDDMLLFASDFPHWQFDGDDIMPAGIPQKLHGKIRRDNALATYSRLAEQAT